eukprot:TRINITY_DN23969_c0_g1_i1.p1 TRINITY_DN23969_c0_g1~~TRINITY_DN23969_c0_g1_i1.p1  ORF type:complete len:357 (+),score=71.60 TRINITY_DN23969_c0_g1_i1:104-1072(+)
MENGLITKPAALGSSWNTAALLKVEKPDRFHAKLSFPTPDDYTNGTFLFGIAPTTCDLASEDIEKHSGVFFDWPRQIVRPAGELYMEVPGIDQGHHGELWRQELHMYYESGSLFFAISGHPRVKVPCGIAKREYRPCISICEPGVRYGISVVSAKRMRSGLSDGEAALKVARTMWTDKSFSDAVVVCGSRTLPVHRCVLTAASAFFASAFGGTMKEAREAKVVIEDADEKSVESLLQYLYTGHVGEGADAIALLPIAHRLGVAALVELCAALIVEELCEENVVRSVAILRPLRDEQVVRPYWEQAADRLMSNRSLCLAHLAG